MSKNHNMVIKRIPFRFIDTPQEHWLPRNTSVFSAVPAPDGELQLFVQYDRLEAETELFVIHAVRTTVAETKYPRSHQRPVPICTVPGPDGRDLYHIMHLTASRAPQVA